MLDAIATIALVTAIIVNLGAVAGAMLGALPNRLYFLTIGGLWTGFAGALAGSGALLGSGLGPVPPVGFMVLTPLAAVAATAALSPAFRKAILALPINLLIGLNTFRLLGVFFLVLAAEGRLAGPFPYSAGWGDIITGVLALPLVAFMAWTPRGGSMIAKAWNWFGALDLFAAIIFGLTSAEGSPLQMFHAGILGPLPVQTLPFALIPTVLVPLFLILHGIIYAQLNRQASLSESGTRDAATAATAFGR